MCRYSISVRFQSECGKIRTRKNPDTDTFHGVPFSKLAKICLCLLDPIVTKLTFTCSKSTRETLGKGVKYVQLNNKNTRTMPMMSFCCFHCYVWTYFTPCSNVSIVDFEQVNISWVLLKKQSRKNVPFYMLCEKIYPVNYTFS